jgi:hypothetical protein
MLSRHILAAAIFCGAVGTVGGQTAQAQAPSSPRFVKLLLMKQGKLIKSDTKALNMRDNDILKLNAATNQRKINQLNKTLSKLHSQILTMTTRLQVLSGQVFTDASHLEPPNPTLQSHALANLLTTQNLSVRAGLGIAPATPTL